MATIDHHLPRLTPRVTPAFVRDYLAAYYYLRDTVDALRAKEGEAMALAERWAAGAVRAALDDAIGDAQRWLSRAAYRGGCGVPAHKVVTP